MGTAKNEFHEIFAKLDKAIAKLNALNREEKLFAYAKAEITLLGQVGLLMNENAALQLTIAQTADLDAVLKAEDKIKQTLKQILAEYGYTYDEDSPYIWVPPRSTLTPLFDFKHVFVNALDAESVLVSKAIKAASKNKILIREALASDLFPNLANRIVANKGNLKDFL